MYTPSTDEALLQSLIDSNRPFAQQHPRAERSRHDLSSSDAETQFASASLPALAGSPILPPTTSAASVEMSSGGKNPTQLAGRSQEVLTQGAPASSSSSTGGARAAGGVRPTTPGNGGGTGMGRRKPVPSHVPPSVLVTAAQGEGANERDANGNISSTALPFPLPPTASPAPPTPDSALLSPGDAERARRRSRTYSDDTLAVMEEQRRKRAVLHGRYPYNTDAPTPDHARPEDELEPEEKEDGDVVDGAGARLRSGGGGAGAGVIPFPAKPDSHHYYPPSMTQRQILQATGASARRRREQARDSTYTDATKASNGNAFKGCTSLSLLIRPLLRSPSPCLLPSGGTWEIREHCR